MLRSKFFTFDSIASEYDSWFENKGKLIFAIEVQALQQVLLLLPKPWLEVGVGSGRFAQALEIESGLDPSIELVKMARNRKINTLIGQGEEAPFKSRAFGAVFLIVTLCFVDSPLKVLMEANRLLKNDGKIVIGSMLQESLWGKFNELKMEKAHRFYKHATFYSYAELETLLTQAGFLTEKVISTLFQKPDKVENMEFPQQGFSHSAGFVVTVAGKG